MHGYTIQEMIFNATAGTILVLVTYTVCDAFTRIIKELLK